MAKVSTRHLGKNGPQISALAFGGMRLPIGEATPESDKERFEAYDRAIELDCAFLDSADIYRDNEDLLGKYFKKNPERREKVSRESFKRLGLDVIDLYYVHRIDKTAPIEETVGEMKELVDAGKVKYLGLSECSSDTLRRAYVVHPIACVQIEYSPFSLDIEREEIGLLKTCRELAVALVCYSPLGRGMLTGQIKSPYDLEEGDRRRIMPRFSKENFPKNLQLVDQLAALAKKKGCTPGQLTLAWILAQGDDFIPIPGTSKTKNLEENAAAAEIEFSKEEVEEIREICEKADVAGERYSADLAVNLYSDSATKMN